MYSRNKTQKIANYDINRTSYKSVSQIKENCVQEWELVPIEFMRSGKYRNRLNSEGVQKIKEIFQILTKEKFKQKVKK